MLTNKIKYIAVIACLATQLAFGANITSTITVVGNTAKTIDGQLSDWTSAEKVLSRTDFRAPAFGGYSPSDPDVKADVYASYSNYHLYIAVDMDKIASDIVSDAIWNSAGVELFFQANKNVLDKYCFQAVSHLQQNLVQRVFQLTADGAIEQTDTTPQASSFFDGAITMAHTYSTAGDFADRYFRVEYDLDLTQISPLLNGLDFWGTDTIAISLWVRGQPLVNTGIVWGCDQAGTGGKAWLPFQDYDNSQQGFTGGFKFVPGQPTNCAQVQISSKGPQDINKDCVINFADLAIFAKGWLVCTDPLHPEICVNLFD